MAQTTNRLLAALPGKEYNLLAPLIERVPLIYNEGIYNAGEPIRYVYFPESGIVSLLSGVGNSNTIEVGIVGSEGMVGLPTFLGVGTSSTVAVVQGSGSALRIKARDFTEHTRTSPELQSLLLRYTHSLLTQISQSAACNKFHRIDQRLARWLLMTHDRMNSAEFQITQNFLSNMLGVRREGVTKAAGVLQQRDLITYVRGNMKIKDRQALEAAACACYEIIRHEYDQT